MSRLQQIVISRQFIFRNYVSIALILSAAGTTLGWIFGGDDKISIVSAIVVSALGFCYFAQRQKLAEITLFKELFTEFNERYNCMNERLSTIAANGDSLDGRGRQEIVDYFNLCSEEYLFYSEGYIHQEAWRSWCRGMLWYLEREPFRGLWKEEIETSSYYGLTLDVVRRGAKM